MGLAESSFAFACRVSVHPEELSRGRSRRGIRGRRRRAPRPPGHRRRRAPRLPLQLIRQPVELQHGAEHNLLHPTAGARVAVADPPLNPPPPPPRGDTYPRRRTRARCPPRCRRCTPPTRETARRSDVAPASMSTSSSAPSAPSSAPSAPPFPRPAWSRTRPPGPATPCGSRASRHPPPPLERRYSCARNRAPGTTCPRTPPCRPRAVRAAPGSRRNRPPPGNLHPPPRWRPRGCGRGPARRRKSGKRRRTSAGPPRTRASGREGSPSPPAHGPSSPCRSACCSSAPCAVASVPWRPPGTPGRTPRGDHGAHNLRDPCGHGSPGRLGVRRWWTRVRPRSRVSPTTASTRPSRPSSTNSTPDPCAPA